MVGMLLGAGILLAGLVFGGISGGIHISIPSMEDLGARLFIGFGAVAGGGILTLLISFVAFRYFGKRLISPQEYEDLKRNYHEQLERHLQLCRVEVSWGEKNQARINTLQPLLDKKSEK